MNIYTFKDWQRLINKFNALYKFTAWDNCFDSNMFSVHAGYKREYIYYRLAHKLIVQISAAIVPWRGHQPLGKDHFLHSDIGSEDTYYT